MNCRLQAVGRLPELPAPTISPGTTLAAARVDERRVYFGERAGWCSTPVYHRSALPIATLIPGPAIIDEMSSTIVMRPDQTGAADEAGNFVIRPLA